MILPYRHALANLVPEWLSGPYAQSFFVEGLLPIYDVDREWFQQALLSRFPSVCDSSALPLLLMDRRLRRGPYTSELAVRRYLRIAWQQWQLAGLDVGYLLAMQAFLAPEYPQIRLWTRRSHCTTIAAGTVGRALGLPGYAPLSPGPDGSLDLAERLRWSGAYSFVQAPLGTWDYDSVSEPTHANRWWHAWASIHDKPLSVQWNYDSEQNYDDPLVSWGCKYPAGELDTLRLVSHDFKPHEVRIHTIVLGAANSEFDPLSPNAGNPLFGWPNGEWTWDAKDDGFGNAINARRTDLRYMLSNPND